MALLDIEKVINQKNIASRFKLVHLAGLRAKELNAPRDNTYIPTSKAKVKVTTRSLTDLIHNKIAFHEELHGSDIQPNTNEK